MKLESHLEINYALKNSDAGRSLKNIFRWSTFRRGESDRHWREILGATGNDLSHGELMYGIARLFLQYEPNRFSPRQQQIFLYGLLCHDWGEAIIDGRGVGDISAQIKTASDDKNEAVIAKQAILSLDIEESIKQDLLEGYNLVVEGQDPELHQAFKAIEKLEYVITAMKIFQNCQKSSEGLELEQPLVARVLVIDLAKAINVFAPKYPDSIGLFIKNSSKLIDEMYEYSEPWLLSNVSWAGKPVDHPELTRQFQTIWSSFKESNI